MRVTITSRNSRRLPGNSIFASAYPTIEQNTRLPSTVNTATIALLAKNCQKSSGPNHAAKFSSVGFCGSHVGGRCRISPCVLRDPSSIHTNGMSHSTSPTVSTV